MPFRSAATTLALLFLLASSGASAADFEFYGRAGDAIELDFGALPGVAAGATFGGLSTGGFLGHSVYTSSQLSQGSFATDGRLWVLANPRFDTPGQGDVNSTARGFQGRLEGSLVIGGQTKTFAVTVQPGYTGAGDGAVLQSFERVNRTANNPLYVAQQQQRLRYFGFVAEGGSPVAVSGAFNTATDTAMQTFQAVFDGGVNATQSSSSQADGIVGPTTAAWLNAANAPTWDELIDPDPQVPGTFSLSNLIGDFDILPGGDRSGTTPQPERFGASWALDVFTKGSALAKQTTGVTQMTNGISTLDGYGSGAFHSSHRVGLDIDVHVDSSTWNVGNGSLSFAESQVVQHALAFINAPGTTGVTRVLTSNNDIRNAINAQAPGVAVLDASNGHLNHLHIDVGVPTRIDGLANLPGDFNFDDVVDAADYTVWRDGLGKTLTQADYTVWQANYGAVRGGTAAVAVPEPTGVLLLAAAAFGRRRRR
ncbi:hypothetical protein Pla108_08030 [Botrimarina colliarenosi]|uniref:Peptidoglycan binding domain protein n=1 Tax=Botrimarina colliarenosi TaxID=2528001 RepID=A0A5C6AKB9_9BACT|nr:peptidoglycan-binding domain-containing protein [Botrimarina colliarenosi]TWT99860.1 hypothetical protein Pla108_08030 [Botrimarina colliarenosi]